MMSELSSGTWATSDKTALAMFLVSNPQFRDRILDLINLYSETPISPEVREGGQVHIIRLWTKEKYAELSKNMWRSNEYEQDAMIDKIKEIAYIGTSQTLVLWELFPGFNLGNLDDIYYPVFAWNEANKEKGGYMEVRVDYTDITRSTLVIRGIKKTKE